MGQELKDVIIGVVDNYNWDKIKYWANSIKASGFTGHKALIVYNMDAATVAKLEAEQFMLIGAGTYEKEKGFTLLEILTSLAVFGLVAVAAGGVLLSVVVVSFTGSVAVLTVSLALASTCFNQL